MAARPTMRELADARKRVRLEEIKVAIREGRLKVRQMTPGERKKSDARRATVAQANARNTGVSA